MRAKYKIQRPYIGNSFYNQLLYFARLDIEFSGDSVYRFQVQ